MKAGKELDALIAEKVMGWTWEYDGMFKQFCWSTGSCWRNAFKPSTDIGDAWLVVEKLQENEWEVVIETRSNQTEVKVKNRFGGWVDIYGSAETAPLAICLASLKFVGIEI